MIILTVGNLFGIGAAVLGAVAAGFKAVAATVVAVAAKVGPALAKIGTKLAALASKIDWKKVGQVVEGASSLIGAVSKLVGVKNEDDPMILAMKAEKAEKDRTQFETTQEYIDYLNKKCEMPTEQEIEEVKKDQSKKMGYQLMGMAIEGKAAGEKLGMELSPEFYLTVGKIQAASDVKVSAEQLVAILKEMKKSGLSTLEVSNYLEGKAGEETEAIGEKFTESVSTISGIDAEECIAEWKTGVRSVGEEKNTNN